MQITKVRIPITKEKSTISANYKSKVQGFNKLLSKKEHFSKFIAGGIVQ
jgi:hypothetical protein